MSESNMDSLLVSSIQLLEGSLIVETNIGQCFAMQKFQCCGAANHKMHSLGKKRSTVRHGCPTDPLKSAAFRRLYQKSLRNNGISQIKRAPSCNKGRRSHAQRQGVGSSIRRVAAFSGSVLADWIMRDSHAEYK
jgi:hypothetical protein